MCIQEDKNKYCELCDRPSVSIVDGLIIGVLLTILIVSAVYLIGVII